jgi:transposase
MTVLTSVQPTIPQEQILDRGRLVNENRALRAELGRQQRQMQQLQAEFEEVLADKQRLEIQLAEVQRAMAQLMTEHERLTIELNDLKQAPFKSHRRASSPQTASSTSRRGRPAGHPGQGRPRPARVDQTERIEIGDNCPDCGTLLTGEIQRRSRVIEDIEPIRPTVVTRYEIERGWCPECRRYQENPVTAALPRYRLGLHLMLFVVYQKVALGLSYGKIKRELATYFSLSVSRKTLQAMVSEVARLFGPAYKQLISLMREQAVLHVDETGWRVDGVNHWLWIFVNDVVTFYVLSRSRGSKVPKALLGHEFEGVLISDFFSAYSPLDYQKAKCWAHLLRDTQALTKGRPPPDSERLRFHHDLHHLFLEMGLALEKVATDETARQQLHQQMQTKLLALAQQDWQDPDCLRLAHRIEKHLEELLLWLCLPDVSPDNNQAERELRPAVITRKTSFGSRSRQGAHAFAVLLSLIRTWERQGDDFFTLGQDILTAACS